MSKYKIIGELLGDLEGEVVEEEARRIAAANPDDVFIVLEELRRGMSIVSDRFDDCEYFIGDLIYASKVMSNIMDIFHDCFIALQEEQQSGTVLLCTVEGDIHDVGKNIVKAMLMTKGITVEDLGVNVAPDLIVDTIRRKNIHILALSGVMRFSLNSMKTVSDMLKTAGLREQTKIIVGGVCVNEDSFAETDADAWSADANECAQICLQWLSSDPAFAE
ncbi:MAG: cobalamin-dependent protein [Lachnospiraceae bacterium]|nr:cobalamin-dependent protein [Lachnospiraceae bacterium]